MPQAERQRLLAAYHLALEDLLAGRPAECWSDCRAATLVALHLLDADRHTAEAIEATQAAHAALEALRQGSGSLGAAAGACGRFAEVWAALLVAVPLRRLETAKCAVAALL
ncbi:MAG: hypothetical protein KDG57_20030 [Rhodoferax sp.]|nr:hypothetical protein [Rhodoferax sp.]